MRRVAYSIAIREALEEEMNRDPSVFLLGEDIGQFGGCFGVTRGMLNRFGSERVRDTPISENSIVGVAVGAALLGKRPVVEIMFMDFITLAMDQIVNHAAKFHYVYAGGVKVPMVIRTASGAGRGYGATHSQSLESWLLNVPGLKVIAPAFPQDAKDLLKNAIRDDNPVVFLENKVLYGYVDEIVDGVEPAPIGKARIVRNGEDVTLISYSRMLHESIAAADALRQAGISAEVVDLRTLHPLDIETLVRSVAKTRRAVVIEEGVQRWGVGSEISCQVTERCFSALLAPVQRLGLADVAIPCGYEQEQLLLPNATDIVKLVAQMVQTTRRDGRHHNHKFEAVQS